MAGRTQSKFVRFLIGDTGATLREVPVSKIGDVNLQYPDCELTALQDAVKGFFQGLPDFKLEFSGPMDTSAAVAAAGTGAAPTLSGSHTILYPLLTVTPTVPVSWAIYIGIQAYWATGMPVFGMTKTSTSGVVLMNYAPYPDGEKMSYKATIRLFPGSSAPAWGTAAIS
jgi:hypothetical protein